ncbi:MAG: sterol desaturase family protein [Flavisolibacter sp.]
MQLPDVSRLLNFLAAVLAVFAVVVGRYILISALFHLYFYAWQPERWRSRKISGRSYPKKQMKKEIGWSVLTAFLFAVAGAVMLLLWQKGYTRIYAEPSRYPLWWLPLSLATGLFLHETYYYWIHRWMHRPKVFRWVHKVHHDSHIPSPWTAFSFHPLEGCLQAVFLPALLLVLPMQVYILLIQLTIMSFSSVINHLDVEIYPKGFHRHFLGKWLIGASHHSLHHKQYKCNFGLYFTFWDKWKQTESPFYAKLFEEKTHDRPDDKIPSLKRTPGSKA